MKKTLAILLVLILAFTLFAACGDKDKKESSSQSAGDPFGIKTEETAATEEPTAEPTPEPTAEPTEEPTPEPTNAPIPSSDAAGIYKTATVNGMSVIDYLNESIMEELQGTGMTLEMVLAFMGVSLEQLEDGFMTFTLNPDGTCSAESAFAAFMGGDGQILSNGTWEQTAPNKLTITFEGEPQEFDFDGTHLTIENEGMTIVLEKIG